MERDVSLAPGQETTLGAYAFRLESVEDVQGPNYSAIRARITVTRNDKPETVLLPERRQYDVQQQSLAEASLGLGWGRDLLATLGDPVGNDAWSVRLQVRPVMRFVWTGALLMAIGGLLATFDRRYRRRREAQQQALAGTPLPGGAT
jgi:cytochrome c-type biogenesis protein CcmF